MKKVFVFLAAAAFMVAFTAPAFAAEWGFYGHARMSTFWVDEDFGDFNPYGKSADSDDDFDLEHYLQGNSRIGANVKVSDNLSGRFEYGTGINLRILWGEYDFGSFKLGVGQHYTPVNIFISNQVFGGDTNMLPFGGVYSGRRAMVQGQFGGFKIALVEPTTTSVLGDPVTPGLSYVAAETDVVLPRIEAAYNFSVGGVSIGLQGGYQTFDVVAFDDSDESVDSWIGAFTASYNAGPFSLAADVYFGQNIEHMQLWCGGNGSAGFDGVSDILDNDAFGFLLVAGFSANENLRFEAGYGQAEYDLDDSANEDEVAAYYVQATITFAKGVFIVPEIGVIDFKDDQYDRDEGKTTYYGLQWQIRF